MRTMKSWVTAVVACSAIASQADADVFMVGSFAETRDRGALVSSDVTDRESVGSTSRLRAVFVSGSLINKRSTGSWLMSQCVRRGVAAEPRQDEAKRFPGRGQQVTPVPPAGTESQPISTFAHFAQQFKSNRDVGADQAASRDAAEIVPSTSNMTLIGLFAFALAGVTAFIGVGRKVFSGSPTTFATLN